VHCVRLTALWITEDQPQGLYWAGRTPPLYKAPPNMATANFVVIWKTDVKLHADEYTYLKIKTGNRIPVRRPSIFLNLNLPPSVEGPLSVAT